MVREGVELMPASWEKAIAAAAAALKKAGDRAPRRSPAATTTNEEAFLLAAAAARRPRLEPPLRAARRRAAARRAARAGRPEAAGERCRTSSSRTPSCSSTATRSTRRRSGTCASARASAATAPSVVVASARARPRWTRNADGHAALRARRRRGLPRRARRRADRRHRQPRRRGQRGRLQRHRDPRVRRRPARRGRGGRDRLRRARADRQRRPRAAEPRVAPGPRRASPAPACSSCPRTPNGRGLREAGFARRPRPGLRDRRRARPRRRRHRRGPGERRSAHGLAAPRRPAAHLPGPPAVGARARHRTDGDRRRVAADGHGARVRRRRLPRRGLPREGGHAHASGRAPAAAAPGDRPPARPGRPARHRRAAAVAGHRRGRRALGYDDRRRCAPARRSRAACSTPSRSTRASRSRRSAAAACAGSSARRSSRPTWEPATLDVPQAAPAPGEGKLRLGTYRPLWAAKDVDLSPALHFIRARQVAELSPADAAALGINEGDRVEVGNGTRVHGHRASCAPRSPPAASSSPRARARTTPTCSPHGAGRGPPRRPGLASSRAPSPSRSQPAVEGLAEMPPSAGLPIPPRDVT